MKRISILTLILCHLFANGQNQLTKSEIKQGFKLLFDGKSLENWHNFKTNSINPAWQIKDGAITLTKAGGGDIISAEKYDNFELLLEWKISDCGNSGIFYRVSQDSMYNNGYETGPEMQILDNKCHPDNKQLTHQAGALYDMKPVSKVTVKKAGQWNLVKIKILNNKVEHWLNGIKVVEYTLNDASWAKLVKYSKFHDWKGFGTYSSGHIGLQDHGDIVSFRNIRIRKL